MLSFLDLTIELKGNTITTKTFRKETSANTLLLAASHHPRSLIQGIPVGQFLRIKRNCSHEEDFENEAKELYGRFRKRGYLHQCIRKTKKKAMQADREDLLDKTENKKVPTQQQSPVRIITKYGTQWDQVKSILGQHWHLLSGAPLLGQIVGDRPLLTAGRSHNLKDNLVHSEYQRSTKSNWLTDLPPLRDMYPCGRCKVCKCADRTNVFASSDGKKNFKINNFINCSTMRVVYMLTCPYGKAYVGKTKRPLKDRIGKHIQSILKKDDERPLALHFIKFHNAVPKGLLF